MAIYTPLSGDCILLDKMLKKALSTDESYILKLYQNNYTPDDSAATGSFTEATFTSYAAITLTRAGWFASVIVSTHAETSYATQSWTCGASGNTIYGYYVTGATSGTVLWAELFATSRSLQSSDVLNLTPKFTLQHA